MPKIWVATTAKGEYIMKQGNEIIIKGKTKVCNKEIPNIYGGFGNGQKVILAKTVAEIHELETRVVNQDINRHIKKGYFEEGIDFIDLKQVTDFNVFSIVLKNKKILTQAQIGNAKNIYVFNESGYIKLSKIIDDKVTSKQVLENYFNTKEDKIVIAERYENSFKNFMKSILSEYIVVKTQFPILNYRVDFFIPELKLIIEYDEYNHKYQTDKDEIRENNIQNEFKRWEENEYTPVKFIRVKENEELEGMKLIMREVSKNIESVIRFDRISKEKPFENINSLYDFYSDYYTKEYCDDKLKKCKNVTYIEDGKNN